MGLVLGDVGFNQMDRRRKGPWCRGEGSRGQATETTLDLRVGRGPAQSLCELPSFHRGGGQGLDLTLI